MEENNVHETVRFTHKLQITVRMCDGTFKKDFSEEEKSDLRSERALTKERGRIGTFKGAGTAREYGQHMQTSSGVKKNGMFEKLK